MSEIFRLHTQSEIDEEAAAWVWRLDSNEMNDLERKEFETWLHRDPRHHRALDEFSKVWGTMDRLAYAPRNAEAANLVHLDRPGFRQRRFWWSLAASLLLCVLGSAVWLSQNVESQTLATAVGQRQSFTLADGSVVTLNTNSILQVELRRETRDIYLQKGEAHFQVAHDRSRPFLVHAGEAVVRAVGTQFDVRLRSNHRVDVAVNEGRVEVRSVPDAHNPEMQASKGSAIAAVRALNAGESVSTYSPDLSVVPMTSVELSNAMAWRDGAIVLNGQPLSEAIAEVGRYTDAKIVVSDPQVAALPVGGRFKTDDLQGFLAALQAALPVTVHEAEDGLVYIGARP